MVTEPTKNGLLRRIRDREHTVTELVEATGIEQSNVSHHLRVLREAGLVKARRDGRKQRYRLADRELANILGDIEAMAVTMERVAYLAGLELTADPAFHGYG